MTMSPDSTGTPKGSADVSRSRRFTWLNTITVAWWIWLSWLVLHSLPPSTPSSCWVICGSSQLPDLAGNVAAFGVATFLLARAGAGPIFAALAGIALVLTAEALQWTVLVGRHPSLSDVFGGSVGSILGVMAAGARASEASVRVRGALLALAWGGWLGVLGLTSWAFQPVLGSGPVGIVVTPAGREMGLVATPDVSGGSLTVTGGFTSLPAGGYRTLAVVVGEEGWVAEIAVWWRGLVFGISTNGKMLDLPTPGLHLIRTLSDSGADSIRFVATRTRGIWTLEASRPGWSDRIHARPSPLWGWALLYPVRYAMGWERHVMTTLFTIVITIPLGLLTGWVRRGLSPPLALSSVIILGVGLGLIPWGLDVPMTPAWYWMITVASFVGGALTSGRHFDATNQGDAGSQGFPP